MRPILYLYKTQETCMIPNLECIVIRKPSHGLTWIGEYNTMTNRLENVSIFNENVKRVSHHIRVVYDCCANRPDLHVFGVKDGKTFFLFSRIQTYHDFEKIMDSTIIKRM